MTVQVGGAGLPLTYTDRGADEEVTGICIYVDLRVYLICCPKSLNQCILAHLFGLAGVSTTRWNPVQVSSHP